MKCSKLLNKTGEVILKYKKKTFIFIAAVVPYKYKKYKNKNIKYSSYCHICQSLDIFIPFPLVGECLTILLCKTEISTFSCKSAAYSL